MLLISISPNLTGRDSCKISNFEKALRAGLEQGIPRMFSIPSMTSADGRGYLETNSAPILSLLKENVGKWKIM